MKYEPVNNFKSVKKGIKWATAIPPATNSAFSFGAPKPRGKCPRLTPSSTTLPSTRHYILYIESITGMLTFIAAITQLNHVLISN